MVQFVYIDETGSVGKGASKQPLLCLVAVLVDEEKVLPLADALEKVIWKHLEWIPLGFEFHGVDLFHGKGHWNELTPAALIETYRDALNVLESLDLKVAFASIDKQKLHDKYTGEADKNAYQLALQFLLEKVDRYTTDVRRVVVADEAREEELRAIRLVAELRKHGNGLVPGRKLATFIDSMHFVSSNASPGVQMADLVAFILQRRRAGIDKHPDAALALGEFGTIIDNQTVTWREPWPSRV